jgi:hypothetical protein
MMAVGVKGEFRVGGFRGWIDDIRCPIDCGVWKRLSEVPGLVLRCLLVDLGEWRRDLIGW